MKEDSEKIQGKVIQENVRPDIQTDIVPVEDHEAEAETEILVTKGNQKMSGPEVLLANNSQ